MGKKIPGKNVLKINIVDRLLIRPIRSISFHFISAFHIKNRSARRTYVGVAFFLLFELYKLSRDFNRRLFTRHSTWPLCQYLVHVSSNTKSLHLPLPMSCGFV